MTNMTRRRSVAALAGLSTGLFFGNASAQGETMRIGVITQLSGFAQTHGTSLRAGAMIAADNINAAGGVLGQKIELVVRDDKGSTDGAVAACRELTDAGVKFFIGGPISGPAVAMAPLFANVSALFIGAGPSNLSLTHERYNPNVFRLSHNTVAFNGGIVPTVVKENPTVLKWAAVAQDAQATTDQARLTISRLKTQFADQHKATIQAGEIIATKGGAGDFRSVLAQLAAGDAQGLIVALSGADAITFFKQARAYQLDKRFKVFVDNGQEMLLAKALGNSMPNNLWSPASWYHGADPSNKISAALYDEYVKRTGDKLPYGFVGNGHDAVLLYAAAAKAAGAVDPARMRVAMEQGAPLGALGKLQFRKEDHAFLGDCTYLKFNNDAKAADGWKITRIVRIPAGELLEPASPGQPFNI